MLTKEDIELLKGLLQGRIHAARANKSLDQGEKARLVREYEVVMHKLGNPRLLTLIQHSSV
jgi:hypothetical protein